MNTYLQRYNDGKICKLNRSPAATKTLIATGKIVGYAIIKSNQQLRRASNNDVPAVRLLADGTFGYLGAL